MKQRFAIMSALCFVFATAIESPAAHDIQLKNGHVFTTDQYRLEPGIVRFSYLNGRIGITRQSLEAIKDSDALPAEETDSPRAKAPTDEAAPYQAALRQNQREMRIQRENFRLAKKYNLETAKDKAWRRLTDLKMERQRMREEILAIHNGTLPKWWDEILNKKQFFIKRRH